MTRNPSLSFMFSLFPQYETSARTNSFAQIRFKKFLLQVPPILPVSGVYIDHSNFFPNFFFWSAPPAGCPHVSWGCNRVPRLHKAHAVTKEVRPSHLRVTILYHCPLFPPKIFLFLCPENPDFPLISLMIFSPAWNRYPPATNTLFRCPSNMPSRSTSPNQSSPTKVTLSQFNQATWQDDQPFLREYPIVKLCFDTSLCVY